MGKSEDVRSRCRCDVDHLVCLVTWQMYSTYTLTRLTRRHSTITKMSWVLHRRQKSLKRKRLGMSKNLESPKSWNKRDTICIVSSTFTCSVLNSVVRIGDFGLINDFRHRFKDFNRPAPETRKLFSSSTMPNERREVTDLSKIRAQLVKMQKDLPQYKKNIS